MRGPPAELDEIFNFFALLLYCLPEKLQIQATTDYFDVPLPCHKHPTTFLKFSHNDLHQVFQFNDAMFI